MLLGLQSLLATRLEGEPGRRPWSESTPCLSADGRFVAFEASRSTLQAAPPRAVGPPPNGGRRPVTDIVVADLASGIARVETRGARGEEANGTSAGPRLDSSGKLLVFSSEASNLTSDDFNGTRDVFFLDRASRHCRRLAPPCDRRGFTTSFAPAISLDGRRAAFVTYGLPDPGDERRSRGLVLVDLPGGQSRALFPGLLSAGGPLFGRPDFSPDGRTVVFSSAAVDLVRGPLRPDLPRLYRAFLEDAFMQAWSDSERWHGRKPAEVPGVTLLQDAVESSAVYGALSEDTCVFAARSDEVAPTTRGGFGRGRYQVFSRSLATGETACLSATSAGRPGDDDSFEPSVCRSGRYVAFTSCASDLAPGDRNGASDVFVRDRLTGRLQLVSHDLSGGMGDGPSYNPCISADGRFVAFVSRARNLPGSGGARGHVYVWDRERDTLRRAPLPETR